MSAVTLRRTHDRGVYVRVFRFSAVIRVDYDSLLITWGRS